MPDERRTEVAIAALSTMSEHHSKDLARLEKRQDVSERKLEDMTRDHGDLRNNITALQGETQANTDSRKSVEIDLSNIKEKLTKMETSQSSASEVVKSIIVPLVISAITALVAAYFASFNVKG